MSAHPADPTIVTGLKHWLQNDALPFWASAGRDARSGLFRERFHADRTPDLAAPLRVRVQFRQIYCLSHAAVLGWFPQGAEIALAAWEATRKHFWNAKDDGGFFHILSADGAVSDSRHDSYDHAFAVLALSWLARATGERRLLDSLDELLAYIDKRLTDADGILLEGDPHGLPRRQNPQMHWFEAMLAMHDAVAHPQALARAAHYRRLFGNVLFDRATNTLGEYFTEAFKPAPGEAGGSVEPGHQAEWTWLLRSHERFVGLPPSREAAILLDTALATADPALGLLVDEADRANRVRRGTRRAWLQTELAKAWIAEAEGGRPIPGPVPASTLYHIQVAIVEAHRVLKA